MRQIVAQCRYLLIIFVVDLDLGAAEVPVKQFILIAHSIVLPIIEAAIAIAIPHSPLEGVVRWTSMTIFVALLVIVEVRDVSFLAQAQSLSDAAVRSINS